MRLYSLTGAYLHERTSVLCQLRTEDRTRTLTARVLASFVSLGMSDRRLTRVHSRYQRAPLRAKCVCCISMHVNTRERLAGESRVCMNLRESGTVSIAITLNTAYNPTSYWLVSKILLAGPLCYQTSQKYIFNSMQFKDCFLSHLWKQPDY